MRRLGLPRPSPPILDQLLPFKSAKRKRVAVILREHLLDDFLPPPIQTPLTESDQGNLVGNFLA